ncbi:hypothetical protein BT93_L0305 [Corymbia citriodora subsp. variegata]|uniref:RecQ-mediated genome instability protein 1 n=1 Tax=Corymbia citriodora subsp. variegata TaxID=360336 RepID=A0A8T0CIT2_CORYI|nr:hypothetical protein BT93_L0305 [Corymbia citriodora subsp. variegata]
MDLAAAVATHLTSRSLSPTPQWLAHFTSSVRSNTPLPALQKTAEFRLLGTDITTSLQATPQSTFPAGISESAVPELRIPGPVPVQVLDLEDIGRSRWSQVEAIEMDERGETRKGHEVIRVVPDEEDNSDPNPPATNAGGPHKLLVQDAKGNKAYAFELEDVKDIDISSLSIGAKIVLRDFTVARGVIMLTPRSALVLGGKIEAWDKKWKDDRKKVLKEKAGWREENAFS